MALTFQSSTLSTFNAVADPLPVPYPASIATGDPLVLLIGNKPFSATPSTPAGWVLLDTITNGSVATGTDTGSVRMTAFVLPAAAGGETGDLAVTITGNNTGWGSMYRYTKATGTDITAAVATGTDTTVGTAWSVGFGSDPGITNGDQLILGGVYPTDAANTFSASALAASGATLAALVAAGDQNPRTTTGNDCGGNTNHTGCTAGTATANATWTATQTLATNNAGSAVLVRLREVPGVRARAPYVVGAQANRHYPYHR